MIPTLLCNLSVEYYNGVNQNISNVVKHFIFPHVSSVISACKWGWRRVSGVDWETLKFCISLHSQPGVSPGLQSSRHRKKCPCPSQTGAAPDFLFMYWASVPVKKLITVIELRDHFMILKLNILRTCFTLFNDRLPIVRKFLSLPYMLKISRAYKRLTSLIWTEQARKS